jgi:hypothetical protein
MRVRVFLRQALFTLPGTEAHLPAAVAVIDGALVEASGFGLNIQVDGWCDERGRRLEGEARQILIPVSKIDHVLYLS